MSIKSGKDHFFSASLKFYFVFYTLWKTCAQLLQLIDFMSKWNLPEQVDLELLLPVCPDCCKKRSFPTGGITFDYDSVNEFTFATKCNVKKSGK